MPSPGPAEHFTQSESPRGEGAVVPWLARLAWLGIGCLALGSLALALGRIYQVDEAQNVYMARATWLDGGKELFTSNALHLFPLGWLTTWSSDSVAMLHNQRLLFLGVFWLNTWLLAKATEVRLASAPGAFVLLAAATLAPMWDYGFEIRHENLLLAGLLSIWVLGRRARGAMALRMALMGAGSVLLTFVAAKALVYAFPMAAWLMIVPDAEGRESPASRVKYFALGAVLGLGAVRLVYEVAGAWPAYMAGTRAVAAVSAASVQGTGINIVSGMQTVLRLVPEAPLLLIACVVGFIGAMHTLAVRRDRGALLEPSIGEAALLAIAIAAFFVNPTPFPYNLVLLVPFAFLVAVRWVRWLAQALPERAWPLVALALCAAHALPFAEATQRHFSMTNERQELLMRTAEALTDPARDRVYDAIGMVAARQSIHYWWFLHSLSMQAYGSKPFPVVAKMLRDKPAAVVIKSYRTFWIRAEDHAFISEHYVPLADDFWVLGTATESNKSWTCLHSGRYALWIEPGAAQNPIVQVDGVQRRAGVVGLERGAHTLAVAGGRVALIWLGPRLSTPPALPPGVPQRLFVNWY